MMGLLVIKIHFNCKHNECKKLKEKKSSENVKVDISRRKLYIVANCPFM